MTPDEVERTIHTYDRMAARYAARPTYPLERELGRFVALVGRGGWVIDVGCGPGQYACALAARGLRVIGLDLSARMLAQAARLARLAGLNQVVLTRHSPWCPDEELIREYAEASERHDIAFVPAREGMTVLA